MTVAQRWVASGWRSLVSVAALLAMANAAYSENATVYQTSCKNGNPSSGGICSPCGGKDESKNCSGGSSINLLMQSFVHDAWDYRMPTGEDGCAPCGGQFQQRGTIPVPLELQRVHHFRNVWLPASLGLGVPCTPTSP